VEREELLAQVASLYYEHHQTQAEIGKRLGMSRATISRLLQDAKEAGIVEITVHYPWKTSSELGRRLVERFELRDALVLISQGRPWQEILRGLGVLAARCVEQILTDDAVLGISWGTAVYSTIQALRPQRKRGITVVQMSGAGGSQNPLIEAPDLARLLAQTYDGEHRYLPAPFFVEAEQLRQDLMQEPVIQETLALARRASVAIVGIGAPLPEVSTMLRSGYLTADALAELRSQGAVGDIGGVQYDAHGRVSEIEFNRRVVSLDLQSLHQIPWVIGVAGGSLKGAAILGALRGRHVNVLVTNDAAAAEVLRLDGT
jgi:DNA-binding transcriptional regulator LsrR (DeoR family)